jgi:hypothetical protein
MAVGGNVSEGSPIRRGVAVINELFCKDLPPAPPNVDNTPPKFDATKSTRERFVQHSKDPACSSCHNIIDNVGFAFENYDGVGRFVKMRGSAAIDASGWVELDGARKTFKNAREMVDAALASEEVARCATTQWTRYMLGRRETAIDEAGLNAAFNHFKTTGRDLREFVSAFMSSKAFLYRAPSAGEVLP